MKTISQIQDKLEQENIGSTPSSTFESFVPVVSLGYNMNVELLENAVFETEEEAAEYAKEKIEGRYMLHCGWPAKIAGVYRIEIREHDHFYRGNITYVN